MGEQAEAPRRRRGFRRTAAALLVVWLLFTIHSFSPVILFVSPLTNYAFMTLVHVLPTAALLLFVLKDFPALQSPTKTIALVLAPLWLTGLPVIYFHLAKFVYKNGHDWTVERVQDIEINGHNIVAYRRDAGAFDDGPTIVVRDEHPFLPGMVRVNELHREHGADDAEIVVLADNRIQVTFEPVAYLELESEQVVITLEE